MAWRLLVFGSLLILAMSCITQPQKVKHHTATSRIFPTSGTDEPTMSIAQVPPTPPRDKPTTLPDTLKLSTGRYYALVIGINRYQHIPRLKTAVNDARTVAKVLQNQYGFQVTELLDEKATRKNILRQLERLGNTLTENDHLLIYYAGHGYFDKKRQKAYWQPVEAEDYEYTWIIADRITSGIKANAARNILIVSDSCYSGTLTRGWTPTLKNNRQRYLQKMLETRSRLLIASGGDEPVSDSGGEGHSIFAKHFLKGLRNMEEQAFTAEELFKKYLQTQVQLNSHQTPKFQLFRNSDHEGGDFVFYKQ